MRLARDEYIIYRLFLRIIICLTFFIYYEANL